MQPPCELMVNDFLPNIRGVVSHELHERGESQRRIALLLGITQARVSHYLNTKKSQFSDELANKFNLPNSDVNSFGKILAEDISRSKNDGIFTLYSIWKNILFSGAACGAHKRKSNVPEDCSACMVLHKPTRDTTKLSDQETEDMNILREISDAATILGGSTSFPSVMPEVSVNIAMSRNNPKSSRDVAAIPGRINRIHGRAKAFVLPEFGSSKHMSRVLLIANARNANFRAALNIRYDEMVKRTLDEMRIPWRFTETRIEKGSPIVMGETDSVLARLSGTRLPQEREVSNIAVIDRGSAGVEPITYLIGKKAKDLAEIAISISRLYEKTQYT